jgi:hypothetical protein
VIPIYSVTNLENSPEGPMTYHTFRHVANGLLCLPISPINASHYDMTRLCPIAIDYNIFNVLIIPNVHIAQLVRKSICITARTCVILKSQRRACHPCRGHAVTELSDLRYKLLFKGLP